MNMYDKENYNPNIRTEDSFESFRLSSIKKENRVSNFFQDGGTLYKDLRIQQNLQNDQNIQKINNNQKQAIPIPVVFDPRQNFFVSKNSKHYDMNVEKNEQKMVEKRANLPPNDTFQEFELNSLTKSCLVQKSEVPQNNSTVKKNLLSTHFSQQQNQIPQPYMNQFSQENCQNQQDSKKQNLHQNYINQENFQNYNEVQQNIQQRIFQNNLTDLQKNNFESFVRKENIQNEENSNKKKDNIAYHQLSFDRFHFLNSQIYLKPNLLIQEKYIKPQVDLENTKLFENFQKNQKILQKTQFNTQGFIQQTNNQIFGIAQKIQELKEITKVQSIFTGDQLHLKIKVIQNDIIKQKKLTIHKSRKLKDLKNNIIQFYKILQKGSIVLQHGNTVISDEDILCERGLKNEDSLTIIFYDFK